MNLTFKPNVTVTWTTTNLHIAQSWCRACADIVGRAYVPTVTSGLDGTHSLQSGHFHGRALDFRKRDIPVEFHARLRRRAAQYLGTGYRCLTESDHFHCQRNKGTTA